MSLTFCAKSCSSVRRSSGGRWWRGRGVDGDASGGVLRSAGAFGDEMVGGGVGGSNLTRAARVHHSDAVDADVGRVRGLPGQGCGLALINRVRVRRQRGRGSRCDGGGGGGRRGGATFFAHAPRNMIVPSVNTRVQPPPHRELLKSSLRASRIPPVFCAPALWRASQIHGRAHSGPARKTRGARCPRQRF
jgi:hypothetical protein